MPTCWPEYPKFALIDYTGDKRDFAVWLSQRLFYVGVPCWVDAVDRDGLCGAGTIQAVGMYAWPIIVVVSPNAEGTYYSYLNVALAENRPVIVLVISGPPADVPITLVNFPAIHFDPTSDEDFFELVSLLSTIEPNYPPIKKLDMTQQLDKVVTRLSNYEPDTSYTYSIDSAIRFCLYAMRDLETIEVRARALATLGQLQIQPGMLMAAHYDPSPAIRAVAELSLKQYQYGKNSETRSKVAFETVFISYARKDSEEFVSRLAQDLRGAGIETWFDKELETGTDVWTHEIQRAIQRSTVCLFVTSPGALDSVWMAKEYFFAIQFQKRVVSIKHLESPLPLYLSAGQGLRSNLGFANHYEKMLEELLATLEKG